MEEINSVSSRKLTPAENMMKLEKAIFASDARMRMRLDQTSRARVILGTGFLVPFSMYLLYHTFAPTGVMQNHRASAGAYMYYAQNFLGPKKSFQQIYRPGKSKFDKSLVLKNYTKRNKHFHSISTLRRSRNSGKRSQRKL